MKSTLHIRSALLAVGLYILLTAQAGDSQHVPTRCMCNKPKTRVLGPFVDFEIFLRRPGCPKDEIIVTVKKTKKVCLSPDGAQGKRLLKCWRRMQEIKGEVKKCLKRLRLRRKHTRPRKPTS
ncbi:C-X-C motif chemokine 9 [Salminus brasiliensis]|uniref:C-X-C motif chemokine 9 n=1 Tax=Salminus brasiliensis TaxID=930266 RepID=UPI003B83238C